MARCGRDYKNAFFMGQRQWRVPAVRIYFAGGMRPPAEKLACFAREDGDERTGSDEFRSCDFGLL